MADSFLPVQASLGYVLRTANMLADTLTFLPSPRPITVFVLNAHILFITSLMDTVYNLFSLLLLIPEVRSLNIRMLLLTRGTALLLFLRVTSPLQKTTQRGQISRHLSLLVRSTLCWCANSVLWTPTRLHTCSLSHFCLDITWKSAGPCAFKLG